MRALQKWCIECGMQAAGGAAGDFSDLSANGATLNGPYGSFFRPA